jgi:hypothetical protein
MLRECCKYGSSAVQFSYKDDLSTYVQVLFKYARAQVRFKHVAHAIQVEKPRRVSLTTDKITSLEWESEWQSQQLRQHLPVRRPMGPLGHQGQVLQEQLQQREVLLREERLIPLCKQQQRTGQRPQRAFSC